VESVKFCDAFCKCPDCFAPPLYDVSDHSETEDSVMGVSLSEDEEQIVGCEDGTNIKQRPAAVQRLIAKRPAGGGGSSSNKIKVVLRHNPTHKRCGYILKDGVYVVGISANQHAEYKRLLEDIATEMSDGRIPDKEGAVARVKALLAAA